MIWNKQLIIIMKTGGGIFGAIVGGNDVEERKRCAVEVVKRNVSGSITCFFIFKVK